jgi:Zn-dependent protease
VNPLSLGRIFGFPTTVEPTVFLLLAYYVWSSGGSGQSALVSGLLFGAVVFGSVLVHELGHAFAARNYRLGPIAITLHGFGGLTRFSRSPTPWQGILLTLAGPCSGIALGLVVLGIKLAIGPALAGTPAAGVIADLLWVNLFWSFFNLLPLYPLDGGLILFHALSLRMPPRVAQMWAARVGVVLAVGLAGVAWATHEAFLAVLCLMLLSRSIPVATGSGSR